MTDTPALSAALACWLAEPGRAELRPEPLPAPTDGQVLVRSLHSAISRGTETLVFRGEVPASEWERMRAPFQAGSFPAPVKYGYSSVGVVEQGPDSLRGRPVFCLFPHQTHYVVPVDAVHLLPPGVPVVSDWPSVVPEPRRSEKTPIAVGSMLPRSNGGKCSRNRTQFGF